MNSPGGNSATSRAPSWPPFALKLTERFTRVAPDKVRWAVTVDDPSTWTRSWTFAMPLTFLVTWRPVLHRFLGGLIELFRREQDSRLRVNSAAGADRQ